VPAAADLAVLAGALTSGGHQVRVVDLQVEADVEAVFASPWGHGIREMVGLTSRRPCYDEARHIAALVRRAAPQVQIVAGGVHATCYPRECLAEMELDVVASARPT